MSRFVPKTVRCAIEDVVRYFQKLQYARITIRNLRRLLNKFEAFARARGERYLSTRLAQAFLDHFRRTACTGPDSFKWRYSRHAMRVLMEHASTGAHRQQGVYHKQPTILPKFMEQVITDIIEYGRNSLRWSESTVQIRTLWIRRFLEFAHKKGLKNWESLRVADVSAWIIHLESLGTASRRQALAAVRFLFKALFLRGRLSKPLHQMCLTPRFPDDCRPPQIWDFKDIKRLLGAVDRRSHWGKRDYAILLLAIRLGLRSCDIRLLRLDNIRWDEAIIDIVQQKTKRPLRLPMSNDIGDALADYLRHGRPKVSRREVFLRNVAPFVPLTNALSHIVRRYRRKAGLSTSPGYGLHSLRHTVATQLMAHGVPHETISGLLGHVHPDTTRRYLRTDISTLRTVGLDPDEEVRHV